MFITSQTTLFDREASDQIGSTPKGVKNATKTDSKEQEFFKQNIFVFKFFYQEESLLCDFLQS